MAEILHDMVPVYVPVEQWVEKMTTKQVIKPTPVSDSVNLEVKFHLMLMASVRREMMIVVGMTQAGSISGEDCAASYLGTEP